MLVASRLSIITYVSYLSRTAELSPLINVHLFRKHGFLSGTGPVSLLPEAVLPDLARTKMKMPLERTAEGAL